jgi:hypothetical protein
MPRDNIKIFYNLTYIKEDNLFRQWMSDTDLDDYVEDDEFGNIHYKLINELLVLINDKHNGQENAVLKLVTGRKATGYKKLILDEYLERCGEKSKTIAQCLIVQFQNIIQLYYKILSIPSYTNIINFLEPYKIQTAIESIKGKDLHLYRGFNAFSEKLFKIMHENRIDDKTIIVPTFLSTSIFFDIAKKFVNKRTDIHISQKIIWKIIVPNELLSIFNYVYLGNDVNLENPNNEIIESEFLLNMGAILELNNVEYKNSDLYYNSVNKTYHPISYTIHTYVFKGWSPEYVQSVMSLSNFFITSFSDESIIQTRSRTRTRSRSRSRK